MIAHGADRGRDHPGQRPGLLLARALVQLTAEADGTVLLGEVTGAGRSRAPGRDQPARGRRRPRSRWATATSTAWTTSAGSTSGHRRPRAARDAYVVERMEYGDFLGRLRWPSSSRGVRPDASHRSALARPAASWPARPHRGARSVRAATVEKDEIGAINHELERARLERAALQGRRAGRGRTTRGAEAEIERRKAELQTRYEACAAGAAGPAAMRRRCRRPT